MARNNKAKRSKTSKRRNNKRTQRSKPQIGNNKQPRVQKPLGINEHQLKEVVDSSGFLKCALAPFDFTSINFKGIPDQSTGQVLPQHSSALGTISIPAGGVKYFLFAPSPGVAYYTSDLITGNTADFVPVYYENNVAMFPMGGVPGDAGKVNASEFRYVSNVFEFNNTSPRNFCGGSIKILDLQLELTEEIGGISTAPIRRRVTGFPAKLETNTWCANAIEGAYAVTVNKGANFAWNKIIGGPQESPTEILLGSDGATLYYSAATSFGGNYACRGLDASFGSKLVKITAPEGYAQTFELRMAACVEYRPLPNTIFAEFAMESPEYDPIEMAAYNKMAKALPVAVYRSENSNFWNFIKKAARGVSGLLSHIPGPVGMIAQGVNSLV